jgi:hypothetical protein
MPKIVSAKYIGGGTYQGVDENGKTVYGRGAPPPGVDPVEEMEDKLGRNTAGGVRKITADEAPKVLDYAARARAANKVLGFNRAADIDNFMAAYPSPDVTAKEPFEGFLNWFKSNVSGVVHTKAQEDAAKTLMSAEGDFFTIKGLPRGGNKAEFEASKKGVTPGMNTAWVNDNRIDALERNALWALQAEDNVRKGLPVPTELPPPRTARSTPTTYPGESTGPVGNANAPGAGDYTTIREVPYHAPAPVAAAASAPAAATPDLNALQQFLAPAVAARAAARAPVAPPVARTPPPSPAPIGGPVLLRNLSSLGGQ